MYNGKRILGLIPARGGSKGIPHKNIIDLCGKPLISYTIEEGKKSKYIDYLLVSTDDDEIARISKEYGASVPFLRPSCLATDTSKTIEVVLHGIKELKKAGKTYSTLVLLQPTQPLRTSEDIDKAIECFFNSNEEPLVSICEVDEHPILVRTITGGKLINLLNISSTCRRQDLPKYYRVNGCIYINNIAQINENTSFNDNTIPYIMDRNRSIDIDEMDDLIMARHLLRSSV